MRRAITFALCTSALALIAARPAPARACSPPPTPPPTAIPRKGATAVPTLTDIVVIGPANGLITLEGGGETVTLSPYHSHGHGFDAVTGTPGEVVRYRPAPLAGSTEYVVKRTEGGGTLELTRFTTAPSYEKPAGTPPKATSLSLTRVRYPVSDIGAGMCIFAEYAGFATFDWELGSFPDTPADSVVHEISLLAENGGHGERFAWIGTMPYTGERAEGAKPLPVGRWHPYLDPTRTYCMSVTAYPYGQAVLSTRSEQICGKVAQVSAAGAPPPPSCGVEAGSAATEPAGGCALGASRTSFTSTCGLALALAAACRHSRRRRAARAPIAAADR